MGAAKIRGAHFTGVGVNSSHPHVSQGQHGVFHHDAGRAGCTSDMFPHGAPSRAEHMGGAAVQGRTGQGRNGWFILGAGLMLPVMVGVRPNVCEFPFLCHHVMGGGGDCRRTPWGPRITAVGVCKHPVGGEGGRGT